MNLGRSGWNGRTLALAGTAARGSLMALMLTLILAAMIWALPSIAQETVTGVQSIEGFDHSQVGIPLTGKHAQIICESCHIDNQLKGTPRQCVACHNGTRAPGKPKGHPPAGNDCQQCHTTKNFVPFAFDHAGINQPCATCHNGQRALGKPANHIKSNNNCDDCHVTTNRKDVRVDHRDVQGTCVSCHNGTVAKGQPKGHITTSTDCAACHSTLQFAGAVVDHGRINQPCATCHNGTLAEGKPANHIPAPETCGTCHMPSFEATFASAHFDHTAVAGACASCHQVGNPWDIPAPPNSHLAAGMTECANCHTTVSFASANFDHTTTAAPCATCHVAGNALGAPTPPVWHLPAQIALGCDSCHTTAGFTGAAMQHQLATSNADCVSCHFTYQSLSAAIPDPTTSCQPHPSPALNCQGCHTDPVNPLTGLSCP